MKKCVSMTWLSGLTSLFLAAGAPSGMAQSNSAVTSPSPGTTKDSTVQPQPTPHLIIPVTTGPPDIPSATGSFDRAKPPELHLSAWTTEIIKLTHAGIGDQVLLTYIDNTPGTFNLGADQIIYLTEQGVSSEAITEMLQHDADVASGLRPVTASTVPASASTVHITFVPAHTASTKANGRPATNPRPTVTTPKAPLPSLNNEPPPSFSPVPDFAENSSFQYPQVVEPGAVSTAMHLNASASEEETTYPVREPYPEALTAPIVVIRAPGLTPNTVIIDLEP